MHFHATTHVQKRLRKQHFTQKEGLHNSELTFRPQPLGFSQKEAAFTITSTAF